MGDLAFARAMAAGKNETEASHARAKAEADIALSLPAEYRDQKMTRERNITCTQPSRQPSAGGATDAQTPTPMRCLLYEIWGVTTRLNRPAVYHSFVLREAGRAPQ